MSNDTVKHDMVAFTEYQLIKGYSKATRETQTRAVKRFMKWLTNEKIQDTQAGYNDIMAYVKTCRERGNTSRTLQQEIGALRVYYDHLLTMKMIAENPCLNIEIKGVKRKTLYRTFEPHELEAIYKKYCQYTETKAQGLGSAITRQRNKIILGLVINQGISMDELEKLTVKDIQLREGKIHIPESGRNNPP